MTSALQRRNRRLRRFFGLLLLAMLVYGGWIYARIAAVARVDEAKPADAIAVFGAAEYGGRPSPVLHARLDHAVALYERGIAPLVITLGGGADKDSGNTEGGVGRDYLLANGLPFDRIIAETASTDTEEQVRRLAEIAEQHNLRHIVVVSDGTHLFRIREICRDEGLDVYTSPRANLGRISAYDLLQRYLHEILSYTSFRVRLRMDQIREQFDRKPEP